MKWLCGKDVPLGRRAGEASLVVDDAVLQKSSCLRQEVGVRLGGKEEDQNKEEWKAYFDWPRMSQAFKILTGLCSKHANTPLLLSDIA